MSAVVRTWYWAVARWGFSQECPEGEVRQAVFCTVEDAKAFTLGWGGQDPDALLKVYAGHFDREGEWVETQDLYWDGEEWTE